MCAVIVRVIDKFLQNSSIAERLHMGMNFFQKLFDGGRGSDILAQKFGFNPEILSTWEQGNPNGCDYTTFQIPKRRKGAYRTITAPNPPLKALQRQVYRNVLKRLPVHPACTGFSPKKSTVDAAMPHVGKEVVIHMDLKDFFDHITYDRIYNYFRAIGWGKYVSHILTNILTKDGKAPQGAPTSPMISNLIAYKLDARINSLMETFEGSYTRYADDITLSFRSSNMHFKSALHIVCTIINEEGFKIQKAKKIKIMRPHDRQEVLSIIVNKKLNAPRKMRRLIRAMEHANRIGKLPSHEYAKLDGYKSYINMINMGRAKPSLQ